MTVDNNSSLVKTIACWSGGRNYVGFLDEPVLPNEKAYEVPECPNNFTQVFKALAVQNALNISEQLIIIAAGSCLGL